MDNTIERKRSSREKIIHAATEEFAEYGPAGARVDRIAEAAGVNKAMIYYHFSSKEGLFQAIIDSHVEIVSKAMAEITKAGLEDLESSLINLSRQYGRIFVPGSQFAKIALHEIASGGERIAKAMHRHLFSKGLPTQLKEILELGSSSGRFRDVDARQAIMSFAGMNLFYLLIAPVANQLWGIQDDDSFRENRPMAIVDLFLRGVERRG